MIILGIDPGSRITGYGVIKVMSSQLLYIASGCVVTKSENLGLKLEQIYTGVSEVLELYQPQEAAIEQVFVNRNIASALKLGQARGAALVALAKQSLPIHEYSTRRVKQSVVGYGAAEKGQVQHMVQSLLRLSGKPSTDAADALAVAICHAHLRSSGKQL
jgi:crossover junction endodeoxyribonuclease RuvC